MRKKFTYRPHITANDIDVLGHVNNEVYLRRLLEAAMAHSIALGFTMEKFLEMGSSFVVRRHELDYRLSVYVNDRIRVETWVEPFEGTRAPRFYEIYKEADDKLVLTGQTLWVFVDLKTGRPQKIPDLILNAFAD